MDNANTQIANGDFGFTFVGSYLNQCARVEAWTVKILQANDDKTKTIRVPHLFGQKLKAVRELADTHPALFSKPARVIELMQRFEEPAKLRSNLAHAVNYKASNPTGNFYLFYNSGTDDRFWFTEDDMKIALTNLKKLVKEICDQQLKKINPPSSPPQPLQGAAGDL
jgi:hypothetical protein